MSNQFWSYFVWAWFIVQTWCILLLLEVIITGKAYLNLFLMIFAIVLYLNRNMFKRLRKKV